MNHKTCILVTWSKDFPTAKAIISSLLSRERERERERERVDGGIDLCHCVSLELQHWSCGSPERLHRKPRWLQERLYEPQERLNHLPCWKVYGYCPKKWLLSKEAFPWEASDEDRERVSFETLRYFRLDLGLTEPKERSCSNSLGRIWRWATRRSTRSVSSQIAPRLLVSRESDPQWSRHLLFLKKLNV